MTGLLRGSVAICMLIAFTAERPRADEASSAVDFELAVMPVLTRFGCNAGACHGKQRGQNGFQLSLLAFDPDFDFDSLTKESRGRRTSCQAT